MVNWKEQQSFQRLLAATIASLDGYKLNYQKIATFYGEGASYDAIEGRFRVIKKEALKLKSEIESGERPEAPKRGNGGGGGSRTGVSSNETTPRKPRTPRKDPNHDGVKQGRITKPSPKKGPKLATVKRELLESSTNTSHTDASATSSPYDGADAGEETLNTPISISSGSSSFPVYDPHHSLQQQPNMNSLDDGFAYDPLVVGHSFDTAISNSHIMESWMDSNSALTIDTLQWDDAHEI